MVDISAGGWRTGREGLSRGRGKVVGALINMSGAVGLVFRNEDHSRYLIVHSLASGGPAEQSGMVRPGDRLVKIDGVTLGSAALEEVPQLPGGMPRRANTPTVGSIISIHEHQAASPSLRARNYLQLSPPVSSTRLPPHPTPFLLSSTPFFSLLSSLFSLLSSLFSPFSALCSPIAPMMFRGYVSPFNTSIKS